MSEPATNVTIADSLEQMPERIQAWKEQHPEATEYCLNDELEARSLLLVIAANLKNVRNGCRDLDAGEIRLVRRYEKDMRRAAAQGTATEYIRQLNKTEPLEFLGLRITVPDLVLM